MASVIELSGRGLSGTEEAGSVEGALAGKAAETYLGPGEDAAYALVAKRGDVTVERDGGTESYSPGRGYRTVTVVTDVRVLVAVGGAEAGEDWVVSIPMASITGVGSDSGLLRGCLEIETEAGEHWSISCRGDFDPIVEYVETARDAWGLAMEYTDDVDTYVDAARTHLEEGDLDAALSAIEDADALVTRGETALDGGGIEAAVGRNAGLGRRRRTVRRLRRRAYTQLGDRERERALQREDGSDETVLNTLERAREAYRRARELDAPRPSEAALDERLALLDWQIEEVRRTPMADAAAAHARARDRTTPTQRVASLSRALEQYQNLLELSWGPSASFVGDSDEIRERLEEVVLELVDERVRLARRALTSADRFTAREDFGSAVSACAVAEDHLEAAHDVASELAPGRVDTVDAWIDGVDEQRERIGPPGQDRERPGTATAEADGAGTGGGATAEVAPTDSSGEGPHDSEPPDMSAIETRLRELDQSRFTQFVAELWRELGWQTTVFTASVDQYDVMAIRRDPVELRVLIWAVHDPGAGLDAAVVDRCAADREQVPNGDVATLVTTADLPQDVRDRAETNNVKLLDFDDLVELVDRESDAGVLDGDYW